MAFEHLHQADTSYVRALQELMLLSDHVSVPADRCLQCMVKHALSADAYAREAVQLDNSGPQHKRMAERTAEILALVTTSPDRIPGIVRGIRVHGP